MLTNPNAWHSRGDFLELTADFRRCICLQIENILVGWPAWQENHDEDRKSTRLNSSHLVISYAVFCLKKKTSSITRSAPLSPSSRTGSGPGGAPRPAPSDLIPSTCPPPSSLYLAEIARGLHISA